MSVGVWASEFPASNLKFQRLKWNTTEISLFLQRESPLRWSRNTTPIGTLQNFERTTAKFQVSLCSQQDLQCTTIKVQVTVNNSDVSKVLVVSREKYFAQYQIWYGRFLLFKNDDPPINIYKSIELHIFISLQLCEFWKCRSEKISNQR